MRPPDFCKRAKAFHRIIVNPKFFIGDFIAPHWRHKLIIRDPKLLIGDTSLSSESPSSSLETQAYHQRPQALHWRPKLIITDPKLLIGDPSLSLKTPEVPHWRPKNERPCKLFIENPQNHLIGNHYIFIVESLNVHSRPPFFIGDPKLSIRTETPSFPSGRRPQVLYICI